MDGDGTQEGKKLVKEYFSLHNKHCQNKTQLNIFNLLFSVSFPPLIFLLHCMHRKQQLEIMKSQLLQVQGIFPKDYVPNF